HDQSEASIPAKAAISAKLPSPRFWKSVLRCHWGRSSIRPISCGRGVCVGISVLRRGPRPSMSATKMSTWPSRSTSEKSTVIEELLVLRRARRGAARNVPFPSFSHRKSGSSKSSQTYRSGAPSPSTSVNLADKAKYSGAAARGLPASSRKRPDVHDMQRHRRAAAGGGEAGLRRPLGGPPVPVVDEQRHATPQRADEQVQVAVAVHVGQHRSRGVTPRQRDARLGGDVLEPPATQV